LGEKRSSASALRRGVEETDTEFDVDQAAVEGAVAEEEEEAVVVVEEDSEMRFHQRKLRGGAGVGELTREMGDGCEVGL
jgi:hypothetical protein